MEEREAGFVTITEASERLQANKETLLKWCQRAAGKALPSADQAINWFPGAKRVTAPYVSARSIWLIPVDSLRFWQQTRRGRPAAGSKAE